MSSSKKELRQLLLSLKEEQLRKARGHRRGITEATDARRTVGNTMDGALAETTTDITAHLADICNRTLTAINQALKDVENGTYGICKKPGCGAEISLKRLKALPFTSTCIDCQQAAESEEKYGAYRHRLVEERVQTALA